MTVDTAMSPAIRVEDTGNGRFQVRVHAHGNDFLADEPVSVGGLGSGPTPYDLLAAAIGACTAMTLKLYAEQRSWPLKHVSVQVTHDRDPNQAPADRFVRQLTIEGLDADQSARMLQIAERCPVHQTLAHGARFETTLSRLNCVSDPGDHMEDMRRACAPD